ncbi:glycine--tRNA ligase subunit beta [Natranaerobius trueperi]|uniref:Glycine--tRNA ligase beta subunit n=1 Tax=Natranaerobius trueperi TaxID=759412 RepID=A0A226BVZ2_9FIRM|nr:glycine--tRNA ligase subunit beta [Natranaerobius trueperi]OWZ83071.1 glycine--tRNA ligase subunit beta [Natranaerobius trueperi]
MAKTLLFEIGTEELPARYIPKAINQIEVKSKKLFEEYKIGYSDLKVMATPRRLVLQAFGVEETQKSDTSKKRGPSKDIAYDKDGNPTKAVIGFAKGQGVEVEELQIEKESDKEYVYAVKNVKGKETIQVLPDLFNQLIRSIEFPVKMFWRNRSEKFIRPVRWIVAMLGTEVVSFNFGNVNASNLSKGHRFLGSEAIHIENPSKYEELLEKSYVMVDHNKRRSSIKNQVEKLAQELDAVAEMPENLLEEVNFLVEWPTALTGSFSKEFLNIPKEALITCMQDHQKYFGLLDKKQNTTLLSYFITIRNGDDTAIEKVKAGNERVLRARLSDANFFYQEDRRTTLETKLEDLKSIIYREELGSVAKKVDRMNELGRTLLDILELSEPVRSLSLRAIDLSKADLTTQMVGEFPKLQGIMGEKYAKLDGEDEKVARGISEHYLPRFTGDQVPQTMVGTITSIVDKVDNIASSFAIGERPSGNQDPYALRRQALGVVHIVLETELSFSLEQLFHRALSLIPEESSVSSTSEILKDIREFIKHRTKTVFLEHNLPVDIIDAVLASENSNIHKAFLRAKKLNELRDTQVLKDVLGGFNRVKSLADKANHEEVYTELFQDENEKYIYQKYKDMKESISDSLDNDDISKALDELASLKNDIDMFFDNVMVMVDDKHLQSNRLNLIFKIREMYYQVSDFSRLQD